MMLVAERGNNIPGMNRSKDHVALLGLRLVCLTAMVALLTMHIRSVRVFRWEQSVSGGLMVTYTVALVGLALCAGVEECGAKTLQYGVRSIYGMRLLGLSIVVILMSLHFRYLRLHRWENSCSGVVLVLNFVAIIGLALCVGMKQCGFEDVKAFICGAGGVLLAINAITIWRRWRSAGDMTRVVAELLGAMGVPLRRQVLIKASLSAAAAVLMLIDLAWTLVQSHKDHSL